MSNTQRQQNLPRETPLAGTADILFVDGMMERLERFSMLMAKGNATIPQHLRNSPADCMAVVMQAAQWKMNPFSVAQKTHLVNGTLGYEAQLVNSVINAMAPTKDRLHYEWFGDWSRVIGNFAERTNGNGKKYIAPNWSMADEKDCGVRVWATLKGEDEPRELELLLSQAVVRNSTLWASDPKQQLAYLAIKRWSRLYAPDVIMGVYTPDELQDAEPRDMGDATVVSQPKPRQSKTQAVKDKLSGVGTRPSQISLDSVLEKIRAAGSKAELDKAAVDAAKLSDADKKTARAAYSQRFNELSSPLDNETGLDVDRETGEVLEGDVVQGGGFSLDDVLLMINGAEDSDALDAACDLIRSLAKADAQKARTAATARRKELEG